jgi:protein-S-isoprenylcysteine O-methyltransferase Ste14
MVDIRIPIGLMFTVVGIIISVFGFFTMSNTEMYHKSLGINVNIIMGLLMLIFGLVMLYFAWRNKK